MYCNASRRNRQLELLTRSAEGVSEQKHAQRGQREAGENRREEEEIAQLKQGLEDLEEQLRKSHGDRGGRASQDEAVSCKFSEKSFNTET